jgi:YHS domain-containing protein
LKHEIPGIGGVAMKKWLSFLLIFALVLPFACSKEEKAPAREATEKRPEVSRTGRKVSIIDQVSKEPVDVLTTPYSYVFKDVEYLFNTKANMEAFMKDPEKYLKKEGEE